jgi:ribose transport system substrate-binding protein
VVSRSVRQVAALVVAAAVALVATCAGCDDRGGNGDSSSASRPSTRRPHVAYVTNGIDSFWVIAKAGAEAGAKKYDADVEVHMPAQGVDDQKRIVEDLITRGIDGIAISPIDAENETALINQACERTKVITQDSDAPKSNRLMFIGVDNYDAGRMCGALVKEALPHGGKVAIFVGRLEQDNARLRRQGVIDEVMGRSHDRNRYDPPGSEIKGDKYTFVATLTDQFDRARAKGNCEDMLSLHPDLAAVVGLFAYNTPLCLEALRGQGKLGQVKVVAFDEQAETLQAIKDGTCQGTVVQDPYGYGVESVRVLAALVRGDESVIPRDKIIPVPARQIRKDNVDAFWADLKQKTAGGGSGAVAGPAKEP